MFQNCLHVNPSIKKAWCLTRAAQLWPNSTLLVPPPWTSSPINDLISNWSTTHLQINSMFTVSGQCASMTDATTAHRISSLMNSVSHLTLPLPVYISAPTTTWWSHVHCSLLLPITMCRLIFSQAITIIKIRSNDRSTRASTTTLTPIISRRNRWTWFRGIWLKMFSFDRWTVSSSTISLPSPLSMVKVNDDNSRCTLKMMAGWMQAFEVVATFWVHHWDWSVRPALPMRAIISCEVI